MILEACVETLAEAKAAEQGGAHQLELCGRLDLDGLTPPPELVQQVQEEVGILVKVMIRPRGGSFHHNEDEIELMIRQTAQFWQVGIRHFVVGLATATNQLDLPNLRRICEAFPEAKFTLHKVIDSVVDPLSYVPALNHIPNLAAILSSGGAPTALEGAAQIIALREQLDSSKQLIAAGKITATNLNEVHAKIPVGAYHGRRIVRALQ